jgi:quinoprotein glucose dehydrogenase
MRRRLLVSPAGVPCTPPPFGTLVAVNVETGTISWQVPLGTSGAVAANRHGDAVQGAAQSAVSTADSSTRASLGSPNLGGAIVTAGGLAFIAATLDRQLHAFDIETGRVLWQGALPAGGKATPMTYAVRGKQYVAIAAGGDGKIFGKGDEIVVFALP